MPAASHRMRLLARDCDGHGCGFQPHAWRICWRFVVRSLVGDSVGIREGLVLGVEVLDTT